MEKQEVVTPERRMCVNCRLRPMKPTDERRRPKSGRCARCWYLSRSPEARQRARERNRAYSQVYDHTPEQKARRRARHAHLAATSGPCNMKGCNEPRVQWSSGRYGPRCSLHTSMRQFTANLRRSNARLDQLEQESE